ncbi:MAG: hypothetical protein HY473_00320 [Candidatus Sungbacteria bacterium]|uniref:Uncharacterized protein n=1 Tax=Candidatus Sungiibacteriota bacterium TaxID=2750080 RepID=A0A932YYD4_9BACT|nr:hypothetical protein [Candidatus Sungbacteria bacterium]
MDWRWLWAIPVVLILRIAGVFGNVWTGFAIVAIAGAIALLQLLPAWRRFATAVFVGWIILFIGLPLLSNHGLSSRPRTREAVDQRSEWFDVAGAERTRVHALPDYVVFQRWCDRIERLDGMATAQAYEELFSLYGRKAIPREMVERRDTELRQRIRNNAAWREECERFLLGAERAKTGPTFAEKVWELIVSLPDAPRRTFFWVLVLALVAMAVIAAVIQHQGTRKAIVTIAILIVLALLVDSFLWGPAMGREGWIGAPAAAVAPVRAPIIHIEVPLLGSEKWVAIGDRIPACTRYTIESSGVRAPKVKFADGSEERLGEGREFGWRDPVALQGEGIARLWLFEPGQSCRRS